MLKTFGFNRTAVERRGKQSALAALGLGGLVAIAGMLGAAPAGAAEKVIVVVDSSGSMAQRAGNRSRMAAARAVIGDLVEGWRDKDTQLGLIAYGHRRKGACDDIEIIAPVGAVDPGRLKRAVGRLRPVGKTPLSAAVKRAAEALKYTEAKATVVLISDGKENCNADPCAIGRELEKKGIDFTAHVIGFAVRRSERAGLRCLAENTGGRYVDAKDASALKDALTEAVEAKKPAPPASEPLRFETVLTEGGTPLRDHVTYKVYRVEDGKRGKRVKAYRSAGRPKVELEPGRYIVRVRAGEAELEQRVSIGAKPGGPITFVMNAGHARFRAFVSEDAAEPLKDGVKWRLKLKDGRFRHTERSAWETLLLPAGDYSATVRFGEAVTKIDFTVVAGERIDVKAVLGAGVLALRAVYAEGGPPVKKGGKWTLYKAEKSLTGKRERVTTERGAREQIRLPAGDYVGVYRKGEARAEFEATVTANKRTELTVNLNAGVLAVTTKLPQGANGRRVRWTIYKAKKSLDGSRERVESGRGASLSEVINAGEYFVRAVLREGDKPRPVGSATVTVKAGARTEETLTLSKPGAEE